MVVSLCSFSMINGFVSMNLPRDEWSLPMIYEAARREFITWALMESN